MLTTSLVLGFLVAVALLIVFYKAVGWQRMLHHDVAIDIVATVVLAVLFAGTFAGMIVALIGGLVISIVLLAAKRLMRPKPKFIIYKNGRPVR